MDYFRAVAKASTNTSERHGRLNTRRIPSNIPYFVDNMWEWLRPENAPSRRHAIYVSPTPELALTNASAGYLEKEDYVAYKLKFDKQPFVHQLTVKDARDHDDVKAFQRLVFQVLGRDFGSLDLTAKLELAPLFLPGVSASELSHAAQQSIKLNNILTQARTISTFWDRTGSLDESSNGELFFEVRNGETYTLEPV